MRMIISRLMTTLLHFIVGQCEPFGLHLHQGRVWRVEEVLGRLERRQVDLLQGEESKQQTGSFFSFIESKWCLTLRLFGVVKNNVGSSSERLS